MSDHGRRSSGNWGAGSNHTPHNWGAGPDHIPHNWGGSPDQGSGGSDHYSVHYYGSGSGEVPFSKGGYCFLWALAGLVSATPTARLVFQNLAEADPAKYAGNNGNSIVLRAMLLGAVGGAVLGFIFGSLKILFARLRRRTPRNRPVVPACVLVLGIMLFAAVKSGGYSLFM